MANTDPILTKEGAEGRGFHNQGSLQVDGDLIIPQTENEFTNPEIRQDGKIRFDPTDESFKFKDSDAWVGTRKTREIAAMGDSMTANGTYVNELSSLLGLGWKITNMGISGGLAFGMDVRFSEVTDSSAEYTIILGGINDISQNQTQQDIKDALQSMYTKASNAGIKVVAMTILPFGNSTVYTAPKETMRNDINLWILNEAIDIDHVVDIATVLQDPVDTKDLNPIYDSGDGLHPNTAGYELIAETINSNVTFVKQAVSPTLSLAKDVMLNQDLHTFSSPTFRDPKVNTIEAYGTNTSGNPSVSAVAGARNNAALFVKYLIETQSEDPIIVEDFDGNEYVVVKTSNGTEGYIFNIYPQADDTHGIMIKAFSPTYHSDYITFLSSTDTMIFKVGQTGLVSAAGIGNNTSFGNGQVLTETTGVEISRNVGGGDTQFALVVKNQNIASTGRILRLVFGASYSVAGVTKDGVAIGGSTAQNALQILKPANGLGTISATSGGTSVTGVNTNFLSWFKIGQTITANGETRTISAIASATSMTTDAWTNTATNVAYTVPSSNVLRVDFNGDVKIESTTASRILASGLNKEIISLDTTTYPTLTELSYVKGATSSIQTQISDRAEKIGAEDIEITDTTKGIILKSPDGTRYRITVANGGTLNVNAI